MEIQQGPVAVIAGLQSRRHGLVRDTEPELSTGAIYRYFKSKDEIVLAVCEQGADKMQHLRTLAAERGQARLTAQIYGEAAGSPSLAVLISAQVEITRAGVAELARVQCPGRDAEEIAVAFVAICNGFSLQLAIRGDLDPAPFVQALMAVIER
jgi:AcrR family transcriptional regulator